MASDIILAWLSSRQVRLARIDVDVDFIMRKPGVYDNPR
jgi:hypothetical protein